MRLLHRELVLLIVLAVVAVAAFVFTRSVAANSRDLRVRDAGIWFERAQAQLESGDAVAAVASLRRAASTNPDNRQYQLALADALVRGAQIGEARQVLSTLREREPDAADTNLQLARLEAGDGHLDESLRYYQNALTSLWSDDQLAARRQVRLELIRLLLNQDQRSRALSELLVLSASLPDEPAAQVDVGYLYLRAGDPGRAQEHFAQARRVEPDNARARAGAGEAAFELGDYTRARTLLSSAPPDLPRVSELLAVTDLVLNGDPLAARLSMADRRRRLVDAFTHASVTLDNCITRLGGEPGPAAVAVRAEAQAFQTLLEGRSPLRSRDEIDDGFDLVFQMTGVNETACGASAPMDKAIMIIGRRHELEER
jgi:tetratricopeptide (TPR) repeat protein